MDATSIVIILGLAVGAAWMSGFYAGKAAEREARAARRNVPRP